MSVLLYAESPLVFAGQEIPLQTDRIEEKLSFIGEVKGRSYIKIELRPLKKANEFVSENDTYLRYHGSYFESVSGKKYVMTADFSAEERSWIFRCFNSSNRLVYILKGKQKQDGDIDGTCKSKTKSSSFYLRPQ
ncbi:hypothetical protein [Desertivirga arenae]|uniref:hypothetical protein n=1 Tax=Desertivirga arenae TaxID=2810309 RepID=UPI001A969272|nr:hypothetical protein [Pedobacter sp. SYSU D00823]